MSTAAMQRPPEEPNVELMRSAYERERKPDWPPLSEILDNARRYALVRGTALRLARGAPVQSNPAPAPAPAAAPTARRAVPVPHHPPEPFDHKRAAAGDRDDD